MEYLTVGITRRAKVWYDTRMSLKDVKEEELESAWGEIKKDAFAHALESLEEVKKVNEVLKNDEDFAKVAQGIEKLQKLLKDTTEGSRLPEL